MFEIRVLDVRCPGRTEEIAWCVERKNVFGTITQGNRTSRLRQVQVLRNNHMKRARTVADFHLVAERILAMFVGGADHARQ